LQDAYTTNISASLGRRIARRWLLQGGGGIAIITPIEQIYQLVNGLQYINGLQYTAHGSIAYRTPTQSFMGTVDRAPADMYGVASGSTLSGGGAWRWHRPGSVWDLSASLRQQQISGTYLQRLNGWIASFGVGKMLNRRSGMQITYTYMKDSGEYLGAARDIAVHSVQVAVVWREQGIR
jgi:hypothetical protein